MSVVLSEHLPLLAAAPDGIQKLRGLILELAVRGKLVPQDPNDEPASELLKQIAQERARLEAEGTCKKTKPMPPVGEDEQQFELPAGWEWVRLSRVIEFVNGYAFSSSDFGHAGIGIVKIGDISNGGLTPETMSRVDCKVVAALDESLQVRKGDMVIAMSGATTGKLGVSNFDEIFYLNQRVGKIVPIGMPIGFLRLDLTTKIANNLRISAGSAIPNLSTEQIKNIVLALPPLAEQHRIVAKVDELMAICDRLEVEQGGAESAHAKLVDALLGTLTQSTDAADLAANWQRLAEHFATLFTTESSLDALKQTILQLAVMGKLVPQDPGDEPASELLKRIAQEKARLEADGISKKSKPMPPVGEKEQPFPLPLSWEWVRLDAISQLVTDGEHATPTRTTDRSAVPLVTAKNVRDGYLDYINTDFVPHDVAEKCWKRCKPTLGDILLVSVGATLGRLSVLDHDKDMVLVRSVTLIRPCLVDRNYFSTALRSPVVQQSIWSGVKQSAQPCLYLAQSSSLPIPLPPLAEQLRIVAKVNELMALCDRLKADLAESRRRQERLASTLIESTLNVA